MLSSSMISKIIFISLISIADHMSQQAVCFSFECNMNVAWRVFSPIWNAADPVGAVKRTNGSCGSGFNVCWKKLITSLYISLITSLFPVTPGPFKDILYPSINFPRHIACTAALHYAPLNITIFHWPGFKFLTCSQYLLIFILDLWDSLAYSWLSKLCCFLFS